VTVGTTMGRAAESTKSGATGPGLGLQRRLLRMTEYILEV
jgi:hypothetical protein